MRGHTAREAYLKQLEDASLVANAIRKNACQEMGIPPQDACPGLLRDYLEKRVGISEFRTLGYMATFFAHGWAAALRGMWRWKLFAAAG